MAHQDPRYWQVQANSALTLPDGKPLSVVGRRLGHAQMEQVRGVDLMKILLASSGYRCYFYGNTPEHLQQLIQTLQAEYPACQIAGYEPSVFRELTEEEMDMLAKRIRDTKAQTSFGSALRRRCRRLFARALPVKAALCRSVWAALLMSWRMLCRMRRIGCKNAGWNGCTVSAGNRGVCSNDISSRMPNFCGIL